MPTKPYRVLVAEPDDFPEAALASLRGAAHVDLGIRSAPLASYFDQYDAVLTRLSYLVEGADAPSRIRCRALGVPTTGLDHVDVEWCSSVGMEVLSLQNERDFLRTIRGTAEHTILLMLAVLRRLQPAVESVRAGRWQRDQYRGREISGSTVGIVGVGRIGRMVADVMAAMGADVVGFDVADGWSHPEVRTLSSIEEVVSVSDIITLHVPHNRGESPVLGRSQIQHVKDGAVLINTSRGGVIDEAALLGAILSGRIVGVGLDVLQGEPEVSSNPLVLAAQENANIIVTPHIGGNTYESRSRAETLIAQRVLEALLRIDQL